MSYQVFDNIGGPDDVLGKIRDFALACGWTILENCTDDVDISGTGTVDGKRLSIKSPSNSTIANFRSANGKKIFPTQNNTANAYGIGLVCSADFVSVTSTGLWYDQLGASKHAATQQIIGVGIPVQPATNTRLYLNHVTNPAELIVISLEISPGYFQHMAVGELQKIGSWSGGTIYSATRNSYYMFAAAGFNPTTMELDNNLLFSMSKYSSTFLKCSIDAAPLRNPEVLWASAGQDTTDLASHYTGKMLGLPVIRPVYVTDTWVPKIPHYSYLQSNAADDTGRNVNTLNCITVNLPLNVYVMRDPDSLRNFSQCGYVPGVYFISTRNLSPGSCYEISYPQSGQLHQAFPHSHRGGLFGYDGFSIKQ